MAGDVTFTPTVEDYVAAVRANFLAAIRRRRAIRAWVIATIVGAVVGAILAYLYAYEDDTGLILSACLFYGFILVPLIYGGTLLMLPRRARRLFGQQRSIHQPFDYGWSDSGLTSVTAQGRNHMAWSEFHGWRETGPAFLFYLNDAMFQFLPRRALDDIGAQDLRETVDRAGVPRF